MSMSFVQTEIGRVAVAGSGFLADGFDLYIIGEVERVLVPLYVCGTSLRSDCISESDWQSFKGMLSSAALFGAVLGQLIFGFLADRLGRRKIFIATGSMIIFGSLISALVQEFGQGPKFLLYQLVVCRALLGFGIGGEYPLSATICAEGTAPRRRATLMSLVFANQGLGYLLSAVLMCVLAYAQVSYEFMWRFALGFGAVVPLVSLYFRMQMHESESFDKVKEARKNGDQSVDLGATVRQYRWHVLGTAGNWFIFDIVFYANSLFNGDVTKLIQVGPGGLRSSFLRTLMIVCIMLPGYFVGVALINRLGRKNTQLQGYASMALWFSVCGLFYVEMKEHAPMLFITIYGLTFLFSNFGPNLTTYVIPGEIYPSHAKATLHGFSAASGKMGAFLGAMLMPYVTGTPVADDGIKRAMFSCAMLAVAGFVITVFFTPNYGPEDLKPSDKAATVGFVPLRWQRDESPFSSDAADGSDAKKPAGANREADASEPQGLEGACPEIGMHVEV